MMLMPSRMLIFDEPTNHLDVPMKEELLMPSLLVALAKPVAANFSHLENYC